MKILFPYRRTAAGMLRLQMQDARPGDYETLADKHITDISTFRETMEEQTGDLMMADVALTVNDKSRKFRDCILLNPPIKFKATIEDKVKRLLPGRALALDGSTEYLHTESPDFALNGPEEVTNTGFETDTAGWTLNTRTARVNTRAHSGTWSIKDLGAAPAPYNEYSLPSNRMYQVTGEAWAYIESYSSGAIKLELLDASNNVLATRNANTGSIGLWQKIATNIDSTLVRKIRLHNSGNAVVYWDDVSLTRAFDVTIAMWANPTSWPSGGTFAYEGLVDKSGASLFLLSLAGTSGSHSLSASIGINGVDLAGADGAWVGLGAFHLATLTLKRSGSLVLWRDGTQIASVDASAVGRLDLGSTLYVGRQLPLAGTCFSGLIGETMIVKGWAADATTIGAWYSSGIQARNDTIAFWRWQHATDVGRDYSGGGRSLTCVNLDSNDIARDEPTGLFSPYKQRAQTNESLFFGVVDLETVRQGEKTDKIELNCFSPLRLLESVSIADLQNWIVANGREVGRVINPLVHRRYPCSFVSFESLLDAFAALMGVDQCEIRSYWRYRTLDHPDYQSDRGLDGVWFVTSGDPGSFVKVFHGVFDQDLNRSPMSFFRFGNCLDLLRYFQLSSFGYAFIDADPETDRSTLVFQQRWIPDTPATTADGELLDMQISYRSLGGVMVENLYDGPTYPGTLEILSPDEKSTTFGAVSNQGNAFTLQLPIRTVDFSYEYNGEMVLSDYAYLWIEAQSGTYPTDMIPVWEIFDGDYAHPLHWMLAMSYWNRNGGRRTLYARRHHGLTGTREGETSVRNLRSLNRNFFIYRNVGFASEIVDLELDPFKNQCTITSRV